MTVEVFEVNAAAAIVAVYFVGAAFLDGPNGESRVRRCQSVKFTLTDSPVLIPLFSALSYAQRC